MRTFVAAALLALAGLMTIAMGVVNAAPPPGPAPPGEVEVEGEYFTLGACLADGPNVEIQYNNHYYTHWECRQGSDGYWRVWLSRP